MLLKNLVGNGKGCNFALAKRERPERTAFGSREATRTLTEMLQDKAASFKDETRENEDK